ncbi:molybdate ABC transporter permease subunit [Roseateles toxinivorans]|uniref:Molybdenum transport system permease n=1 Tax=Roseateles toxinivorans TaxID=270368 RepID=A0A4R6QUZ3_9BURK|nr:molybdate ABC transporter permease subunit [Roseateles toxinivorans]TDP74785.1 molybdate transport system permease protein [Roseateles toxinivorans]
MDWQALRLSVWLALATALILLPLGVLAGRWLASSRHPLRPLAEALLALPLVLPPTVLGYYLLVAMGGASPLGQLYQELTGQTLAFSFGGLLLASLIFNIPFALMPMQRAFEAIPAELYDAARSCGLSPWRTLWHIELPLAWRGILSGLIMTAAHTLGEFGVVLMVGGSIPGETKTIAISIYDRVQGFDMQAAGLMSATLLVVSLATLLSTAWLTRRRGPGPRG